MDEIVWREVQSLLSWNARTGGAQVRNQFGAILKGILRCSACDCAMTPAHATKKSDKRYRYYNCINAQKRGWDACPTKSVPAQEIERFVIDQIRGIGNDPALIRETVRHRAGGELSSTIRFAPLAFRTILKLWMPRQLSQSHYPELLLEGRANARSGIVFPTVPGSSRA